MQRGISLNSSYGKSFLNNSANNLFTTSFVFKKNSPTLQNRLELRENSVNSSSNKKTQINFNNRRPNSPDSTLLDSMYFNKKRKTNNSRNSKNEIAKENPNLKENFSVILGDENPNKTRIFTPARNNLIFEYNSGEKNSQVLKEKTVVRNNVYLSQSVGRNHKGQNVGFIKENDKNFRTSYSVFPHRYASIQLQNSPLKDNNGIQQLVKFKNNLRNKIFEPNPQKFDIFLKPQESLKISHSQNLIKNPSNLNFQNKIEKSPSPLKRREKISNMRLDFGDDDHLNRNIPLTNMNKAKVQTLNPEEEKALIEKSKHRKNNSKIKILKQLEEIKNRRTKNNSIGIVGLKDRITQLENKKNMAKKNFVNPKEKFERLFHSLKTFNQHGYHLNHNHNNNNQKFLNQKVGEKIFKEANKNYRNKEKILKLKEDIEFMKMELEDVNEFLLNNQHKTDLEMEKHVTFQQVNSEIEKNTNEIRNLTFENQKLKITLHEKYENLYLKKNLMMRLMENFESSLRKNLKLKNLYITSKEKYEKRIEDRCEKIEQISQEQLKMEVKLLKMRFANNSDLVITELNKYKEDLMRRNKELVAMGRNLIGEGLKQSFVSFVGGGRS